MLTLDKLMVTNNFKGTVLEFMEYCKINKVCINDYFSFSLVGQEIVVYVNDDLINKAIIYWGTCHVKFEKMEEWLSARVSVLVQLFKLLNEFGYENQVVLSMHLSYISKRLETYGFVIKTMDFGEASALYGEANVLLRDYKIAILSTANTKKPQDKKIELC